MRLESVADLRVAYEIYIQIMARSAPEGAPSTPLQRRIYALALHSQRCGDLYDPCTFERELAALDLDAYANG